jgi:hypothetical protein
MTSTDFRFEKAQRGGSALHLPGLGEPDGNPIEVLPERLYWGGTYLSTCVIRELEKCIILKHTWGQKKTLDPNRVASCYFD